MSEQLVCVRCGGATPRDTRYCPVCDAARLPPISSSPSDMARRLGKVSRVPIGLLGLALLVPTGLLADHLIVSGLSFRGSLVALALVFGCGFAHLGWEWKSSIPSDLRIARMLLTYACIGVLVTLVCLADRLWLGLMTAGGHEVVYAVPGVFLEASIEGRRLVIVDAPPYGLTAMVYALAAAAVGNWIHGARMHAQARPAARGGMLV